MAGNVGRPRIHADSKVSQIRMEPVLYAKAKKLAYMEGRSMNAQLVYWAQKAVDAYESVHGKIEIEE